MDENGDTGGDHEVTPEVDALGAETPVPLDVADHNSSTENAAFTAAKIIAIATLDTLFASNTIW